MAIAAEILTHLRAEAGQFKAEIASAEKSAAGFAGSTERMAAVGKAAFLGLGAVAVVVGALSVKAAMEHEQAHARLVTAIKNSGSTWAAQAEAVENADTKLRNLGFTDTDTESSLAKLTNATHDTRKATELMGLASDIARGRHIELGAATDILVKVEAGRVGLLGRLGIQTKDTTGATISQHEAVKRLTDLYGGQAQAYTETLSGKLQVLEAQFEHVAVAIGEFLIPKLTAIGSAVADTITWFTKHQAAAIALATVIGGPLVAAMGLWIAQTAIAAGTALLTFWTNLANAASLLFGRIVGLEAAYLTETAAELTSIGADEAKVAALLELDAAVGVSTLAMAGLTLGFAALAAGIVYIITAGRKLPAFLREAADEGAKIGERTVASAKASGNELEGLNARAKEVTLNVRYLKDELERKTGGSIEIAEMNEQNRALAAGLQISQAELKAIRTEQAKLRDEQSKAVVTATAVANSYGIEIPNAANLSSSALKALQSQIGPMTALFGDFATQIAINAGVTGSAMKALVADTDQFAKSLEGSIAKATDPFAHFGDQLTVSQADFEAFFVGSQQQAADWANEITGLIQRGVDLGIINQMAKAGPGSKPSLDAFVAMVEEHGVDWVNSVYQSGQDAAKATEDAYDAMALSAAIKTAEIAQVTDAYFKDIKAGGVENLKALATGGDTELARLAVAAIFHMGQVTDAVNSVPKDVPVVINIQTAGWNPDVIKQKLTDIVGTYTADVIVNSHGSYDPLGGLTGTGIFGDALLQAWPEAAEQLMHRDALRTPTEKVAARGKANR